MGKPNDLRSELTYQAERAAQLVDVTATPDYVIDRYRRCKHWRLFPKELMFKRLVGDIMQSPLPARMALICLLRFDRLLLTLFPFLSRWCGTVVITGRRPLRSSVRQRGEG